MELLNEYRNELNRKRNKLEVGERQKGILWKTDMLRSKWREEDNSDRASKNSQVTIQSWPHSQHHIRITQIPNKWRK